MTRLPRLTLAAALLGGLALPAASFAAVVHNEPAAATSKLDHRAHRAAATTVVTSKDARTKDATPKDAAKPAPGVATTQSAPSDASPGTVKPAAPGPASLAPAAKVN